MSLEFVNLVCPNCKNPNYMMYIGDVSKSFKYRCMNCFRHFNDEDFEKEPLQPVWKSECMNTKVDMVEVVRCKDCKYNDACEIAYRFGEKEDWFCADGVKKDA